jgi:Rieske Fe-S protein
MKRSRRTILRTSLAAGLGLPFVARPALGQPERSTLRPQEGDLLVNDGGANTIPLTPADVPRGAAPITAWAMDSMDRTVRNGSRLNRILLVRLDEGTLTDETRARAAEGVVAYTAICTHTGCEVSEWLGDDQILHCPCHFTKFDPKDGGKVIDGPAPRSLPALPLKAVEGRLVVARPFLTRVGFEPA